LFHLVLVLWWTFQDKVLWLLVWMCGRISLNVELMMTGWQDGLELNISASLRRHPRSVTTAIIYRSCDFHFGIFARGVER
jgi:hypothetical protein